MKSSLPSDGAKGGTGRPTSAPGPGPAEGEGGEAPGAGARAGAEGAAGQQQGRTGAARPVRPPRRARAHHRARGRHRRTCAAGTARDSSRSGIILHVNLPRSKFTRDLTRRKSNSVPKARVRSWWADPKKYGFVGHPSAIFWRFRAPTTLWGPSEACRCPQSCSPSLKGAIRG